MVCFIRGRQRVQAASQRSLEYLPAPGNSMDYLALVVPNTGCPITVVAVA